MYSRVALIKHKPNIISYILAKNVNPCSNLSAKRKILIQLSTWKISIDFTFPIKKVPTVKDYLRGVIIKKHNRL